MDLVNNTTLDVGGRAITVRGKLNLRRTVWKESLRVKRIENGRPTPSNLIIFYCLTIILMKLFSFILYLRLHRQQQHQQKQQQQQQQQQ